MTTASPPKLLVVILTIQVLNPGARNGSPSAMAGLVRLEAAPGYISSPSFHPPSTSSDHRISFAHLLHTIPSSPSLSEASNSRQVPWPWLRSPRLRRPSKFAVSQTSSTSPPPLCNLVLLPHPPSHFFCLSTVPEFSLPSLLTTIPSSTKHPRSSFSPRRPPYLIRPSILQTPVDS